jgi:membrane protein YdbS with pleckstrin-like domain
MYDDLLAKLRVLDRYKQKSLKELGKLAEKISKLREADLFAQISDVELARIAERGRIEHYEAGEFVIHEGDRDKTFYVITRGQVRVWRKEENDIPHLLNYHAVGDFFGELAPLNNAPRAANVDAVDDVELVAFDQDGFERIIEHSQIAEYLRTWGQERIRQSNKDFEGKHWDEISIVLAHKSWFALARMIVFPVMVMLLALGLFILLISISDASAEVAVSVLIATWIGMGLWVFWMYEDWQNDDLIVTSKRVIHIERILVPPFPVERHEVFVFQVQDITTRNHGLWTRLFGVQTLEIKTAGLGTIEFPYLDEAEQIRNEIFRARELAMVRRTGEERSRIRHTLLNELNRPTNEEMTPLPTGEELAITPEAPGLLKIFDYFVPRMRIVRPDRIIWRKHWLILVKNAGVPALTFFLSVAVLAIALGRPGFLRQVPPTILLFVPGIAMVVTFGWFLWNYDGWRNDIYIVTDERIIDIEGSPFHLQKETRTEGPFDVIQNTDYSSPNWLFRILRIGDVTIDTASQAIAYTFNSVARPDEVQQEIFKRLTAFREEARRAAAERQYDELTKWFGTYHRSIVEQREQ